VNNKVLELSTCGVAKSESSRRLLWLYWLWDSPTLTTWASFGARSLNLVLVFPLVLRNFSIAEIALWQVYSTLIGLQLLTDIGFGFTFARLFGYAMGGVPDLRSLGKVIGPKGETQANWDLLRKIFSVTRFVYRRLSWLLIGILVLGGTPALLRRVQALGDVTNSLKSAGYQETTSTEAWLAWVVVIVATVFCFRFNAYASFLQGTNHVAAVRRWEALFGLGSIFSSVLVILFGGGLLGLVVSNQVWLVLNALRNRWLTQRVLGGRFREIPEPAMHADIFSVVWASAWRTGAGSFMSFGVVQISGLIYAQSRDTEAVATYLLAIKLIQTLSEVSQAPFYSKLPRLARCWAQGELQELIKSARRGMALAYWAFVVPFLIMGIVGPSLLERLGSNASFPNRDLWGFLGIAILCERYGAMNLHLYGTTNNIVAHIANGVTGVIYIIVAVLTFPHLGVLALPISMLISYLAFYTWYCSKRAHKKFSIPWPAFEFQTVLGPVICMVIYLSLAI